MNPPSSIKQITVEEVSLSIQEGKQVILLDVRTQGEYARGHLQNSINLPTDELEEKISGVIPDKNQLIYVYCLSGARSDMAVDYLSQIGYHNVLSMKSGLLAWRALKYELVI